MRRISLVESYFSVSCASENRAAVIGLCVDERRICLRNGQENDLPMILSGAHKVPNEWDSDYDLYQQTLSNELRVGEPDGGLRHT